MFSKRLGSLPQSALACVFVGLYGTDKLDFSFKDAVPLNGEKIIFVSVGDRADSVFSKLLCLREERRT